MRPKTASHFSHWVSIFRSFVTHFICVFFSCRCCHFFSFLLWNRLKFRTKPNAALYSFPHFNHTHIKIIIAAFFFLLTYLHTQNSQATILIKFNLSISLLLVKCTCCSFRFFFSFFFRIHSFRNTARIIRCTISSTLRMMMMNSNDIFAAIMWILFTKWIKKKRRYELKSYPQRRHHSHHSSIRKSDMWSNKSKMHKWKNDCWTFVIMWIFPNDAYYSFTHSCLFSP